MRKPAGFCVTPSHTQTALWNADCRRGMFWSGQLSLGEDNRVPLLPMLTWTVEWYFPNNLVMFPFSTGKNAFKAKKGSERFMQSIYYERLSAAWARGRRGCHHHARRQSSKQKPAFARERRQEGRKMEVWYPGGSIFAATKHQAFKKHYHKHLCQSENTNSILPTWVDSSHRINHL